MEKVNKWHLHLYTVAMELDEFSNRWILNHPQLARLYIDAVSERDPIRGNWNLTAVHWLFAQG